MSKEEATVEFLNFAFDLLYDMAKETAPKQSYKLWDQFCSYLNRVVTFKSMNSKIMLT